MGKTVNALLMLNQIFIPMVIFVDPCPSLFNLLKILLHIRPRRH